VSGGGLLTFANRISYRGRTSKAISPGASNDTVALVLMALQDTVFAPNVSDVRNQIQVIFQGSSTVCGTAGPTTTYITFIKAYGDLPPLAVASSNLAASGTSAAASLYFQTTQMLNCTCHITGCGGYYSLTFDGLTSREIPFNADSGFVRASLLGMCFLVIFNGLKIKILPANMRNSLWWLPWGVCMMQL